MQDRHDSYSRGKTENPQGSKPCGFLKTNIRGQQRRYYPILNRNGTVTQTAIGFPFAMAGLKVHCSAASIEA
jgi:hypothetical protein